MKKILFLIHDLGRGGAERVLINLANNLDKNQYDITVMTLFDYGETRDLIQPNIKYKSWCPLMYRGNSHLMKLLSPAVLHKLIIKEHYDIEVSYLEGPCARVISGCQDDSVKLVSWIHTELKSPKAGARSFRSIQEAKYCYGRFHRIVCVSQTVLEKFKEAFPINVPAVVLYNTNESKYIIESSAEHVSDTIFSENEIKIISAGKLVKNKGFDRLLRIGKELLIKNYPIHIYILGEGPERESLEKYITMNNMTKNVSLLGYQKNPYKYISKCDLYICSSHREGFSTAATEALILGIPVCTVQVSGMREMLGENDDYGVIVPNTEKDLFTGIKVLLDNPEKLKHYKERACIRGKMFCKEETVEAVQKMFAEL